MTSEELVSVVIPSYNHALYVGEAVQSVLRQNWRSLELVVIDDGSSDGSVALLRKIRDPRLRLIEQSNAGAHAAINRGLSEAQGAYLAILNSDDIFHESRIAASVELLRSGCGLVASWVEIIDPQGRQRGVKRGWLDLLPWPYDAAIADVDPGQAFLSQIASANFIATTSNMAFTRSAYERIGPFKPLRFAHDWDFAIRAASIVKCALIERPLLRYRLHASNTINTDRSRMLFEISWMFARHLGAVTEQLRRSGAISGDLEVLQWITRAINLQGCDQIMWKLVTLSAAQGDSAPAYLDRMLSDHSLCEALVKEISRAHR